MQHKVRGLVVRESPKGESGKLLTVLTERDGVITVNAKGVRKISAAYLKSAQLFALSDMLLYEKNGFYTLVEASLISDFYSIREDVTGFALACYICECAAVFSVPGEEGSDLLRLVLNMLYATEKRLAPYKKIKSVFEIRLCSECGYAPETEGCSSCGESIAGGCVMDVADGSIYCSSCSPYANGAVAVTKEVYSAISHITGCTQNKLLAFSLSADGAELLNSVSEPFLLSVIERSPKTLPYLKSVL